MRLGRSASEAVEMETVFLTGLTRTSVAELIEVLRGAPQQAEVVISVAGLPPGCGRVAVIKNPESEKCDTKECVEVLRYCRVFPDAGPDEALLPKTAVRIAQEREACRWCPGKWFW